ncbi:MAG: ABC transporter ATP-binding protein/permease [Clostridia bacterium]|nr:ABC transporter ATP-binding protein/permease [Clostridia bacterium]
MITLLKYLRRSGWSILLVTALLFVQAYAELSLPDYTANIVNVGITQGGVSRAAPEQIREETLNTLSLYMKEGEHERALAAYRKNERDVYVLQHADIDTLDQLAEIFSVPMAIASQFGNASEASPERLSQLLASGMLTEQQAGLFERITQADPSSNPLEVVRALLDSGIVTAEQLVQLQRMTPDQARGMLIRAFADALFGDGAQLIIKQMAIAFVQTEYQAIGVDMRTVQTRYLLEVGARMLGMTLLMIAAAIGAGYLASRTAAEIARSLREKVFSKVISFSQGDIEQFSTASLITRSTNDIQQVAMSSIMLMRIALYAPILGIGGVFRVMRTDTGLGWIIYVAVGLLFILVSTLVYFAMPKFNKIPTLIDRLNLVAREILTGLPVIRAFSRETHENARFEQASQDLMRTQLFITRTMALMMPLMMLIMNGISLTIMWFGGLGIDMGQLQVGDMMAFITYTMQIVMSFLMLSMLSVFVPRAIVSAGRIEEVLQAEPSISDGANLRKYEIGQSKGVVSFENVAFRYPGADMDTLSGITFTAMPERTTAIIGSTGSGKSTLINLLPRFYDASGGRITIDGVDIREISLKELRAALGYVPQKGVLFSGDIASNIKFGGESISDEDMIWAAEIAQAADFIAEKKDGYGDPIAQGGTNVSGGQKQRLSIARALAKKPPVLLFDDSFSALDYKTDVALRRALAELYADTTVIIVAQRISTVLHADQIVVLHEGKIEGIGTHRELMTSCPLYTEIAKSQLSEAELGGTGA